MFDNKLKLGFAVEGNKKKKKTKRKRERMIHSCHTELKAADCLGQERAMVL